MVDPDQLASEEPAYQDSQFFIYAFNGTAPPDPLEVRNSYSANTPSGIQCVFIAECMLLRLNMVYYHLCAHLKLKHQNPAKQ